MKFALFAIAAAIGSASAQLGGLSQCASNCVITSVAASGCSVSDIKCLCASGASGAFHDAIASCLLSNCTANDVTAVKAFEAKMCGSS